MRNRTALLLSLLLGALPILAAEVVLPEARLGVTLPDTWKQVPDTKPGILLRATSEKGQVRFTFTKPPIPNKPERVDTEKYQQGAKDALRDAGFTKVLRSELIKVAGADAYLCEAGREDDKPASILQVMWFHEGATHSLVFLSLSKPFKEIPEVEEVIKSVKVVAKE